MELDLDDLLGRVDLIDRRIAREERAQKVREQQEPMNANRRQHKHTSKSILGQKHHSHSFSPAELHSPHGHQRQVSDRPEQERQRAEVSPRRHMRTRSEVFIHAQAILEEERVREYSLPGEALQSSFTQSAVDAPEDQPPSYSEAAHQAQEAETIEAFTPVTNKGKKKQQQQIRAKKYEGALRFLAGRRTLGDA